MSSKIAKALIGGNWKCNGTTQSVKAMAEVLNKAGIFSPNSEVVIAAPSIHLTTLKSLIRPDIAVAAEVFMYFILLLKHYLIYLFSGRWF
jgi:triosephosphate isomerase